MSGRGRGYKRSFDHPSRMQTTTNQSTVQVANATIYLNERESMQVARPTYNNASNRNNHYKAFRGGHQRSYFRRSEGNNRKEIVIPEELTSGLPPHKIITLEKKLRKVKSEAAENMVFTRAYEELEKVHHSRRVMEQAKQAALREKKKLVEQPSPLQNIYPPGMSVTRSTAQSSVQQEKSAGETTIIRNGAAQFQSKHYQERTQQQQTAHEQQDHILDEQQIRDDRLQKDFAEILDDQQQMETQAA